MSSRLALVALLVGAPFVAAHAQVTPTRDPADVKPGAYSVEPLHTQLYWSVSHLGFTTFYGRMANVSGTLTLTPKDPAKSSFDISVPADTVNTTSAKLDGELKGGDWLDVAKYPTITFKSTSVALDGPGHATVTGALTLHGETHPLILDVQFNAAGVNPIDKHYTVGFRASGTVKRSEFGVTKYVPLVGDDVTLMIAAAFEPKGS